MAARKPNLAVMVKTTERDVARARRVLRRVEKEIAADWRYHDYDREAVDDIKALAKALRGVLGPDTVEGPGGTQ